MIYCFGRGKNHLDQRRHGKLEITNDIRSLENMHLSDLLTGGYLAVVFKLLDIGDN